MANSYVVGAFSGTGVIVAAIVGFVVLVSVQALQEWPVSGIGLNVGRADVGSAEPVSGAQAPAPATVEAGIAAGRAAAAAGAGSGTSAGRSAERHDAGVEPASATPHGGEKVAAGVDSASYGAPAPSATTDAPVDPVPTPSPQRTPGAESTPATGGRGAGGRSGATRENGASGGGATQTDDFSGHSSEPSPTVSPSPGSSEPVGSGRAGGAVHGASPGAPAGVPASPGGVADDPDSSGRGGGHP